jgi:putative ABC transport system permease protein
MQPTNTSTATPKASPPPTTPARVRTMRPQVGASLNLWQSLDIAFDALMANKVRAFLTMLGIIIGVMSVVSLMSLGAGAQASVLGEISSSGTNVVNVNPMAGAQTLVLADVEALRAVDGVVYAVPQFVEAKRVSYGSETISAQVIATLPDYPAAQSVAVEIGRWWDAQEERARVVILGSTAAEDLFGGVNPLGSYVRVGNVRFEVIGVLEELDSVGPGQDPNLRVYLPFNTAAASLFEMRTPGGGDLRVTGVLLAVRNETWVDSVKAQAEILLRQRHRIKADEDNDFRISDQGQLLDTITQVTTVFTALLTAIAAVSLVVGGIGIMNISLVSVTERTKEIGLRKAVGARSSNILLQFLIETVLLSFIGGLLGVLLAFLIVFSVNASGIIPATLTWDAVALGLGFSILVGIFFGVYPASRAARLQPIEALRYE